MPIVFRLTKTSRATEAFTGEGARLFGGRWNNLGLRVVYTSATRSLALLETLVHLDTALPLPHFSMMSVTLDEADIETLPLEALHVRDDQTQTRSLGDRWLKQTRSLALAVPSVIVPHETNYLINPAHPRFASLRISAPEIFVLDNRLHLANSAPPPRVVYPKVGPAARTR